MAYRDMVGMTYTFTDEEMLLANDPALPDRMWVGKLKDKLADYPYAQPRAVNLIGLRLWPNLTIDTFRRAGEVDVVALEIVGIKGEGSKGYLATRSLVKKAKMVGLPIVVYITDASETITRENTADFLSELGMVIEKGPGDRDFAYTPWDESYQKQYDLFSQRVKAEEEKEDQEYETDIS